MTERAGLEERIGAEEVTAGVLDLVVRQMSVQRERRVEIEEVIRALFEDDDRPSGRGEHVGCGRAAGSRTDDDRVAVEVGHQARPLTSSSV